MMEDITNARINIIKRIGILFLIQCIALFLTMSISKADISPFEYSFVAPTDADLSQADAIRIADAYYSNHIVQYGGERDISICEKTCHFIRVVRNDMPFYCWIVAYNDGMNMNSCYGFAGMIIVSSPDGRILEFCDEDYNQCFKDWGTTTFHEINTVNYGKIDLIALPGDNRVMHIMPDMNVISEREAKQIACRLIASYEHVLEDDILNDFVVSISLKRDLAVSDYPIWYFTYGRYVDNGTETPDIAWSQYTVAIYAHTGAIWYAIDHVHQSVMLADHSLCHIPINQNCFTPADWRYLNFELLFGTQQSQQQETP